MQSDDGLWDGVRGEAAAGFREEEVFGRTATRFHTSRASPASQSRQASSSLFNTQRQTAARHPRVLPVSAAGYSESCCPVIRCRQTCWELWRLAWSMLE